MSRYIKELCPTVTDAIQAMITGLKELPDGTHKVDMEYFGLYERHKGICYGCAATYTLMKIAGTKPEPDRLIGTISGRSQLLNLKYYDVADFETAINNFRVGHPRDLFAYYYLDTSRLTDFTQKQEWYLDTDNYMDQLPLVEEYLVKLKGYLNVSQY